MPKYLISASYTQEGMSGLLKEGGTSRRSTVTRLIKGMGGSLEAFYYAFGDDDVFVIFDMPDEASATAISLAIGATGAVRLKTTVLISPEAIDEAVKKTVNYRAPGS
ncbi:MAG: GYD domain-containing protein [Chloroflexi bacterium]|nr:GYD domain-containing protein [Chloroflexota bacterium]